MSKSRFMTKVNKNGPVHPVLKSKCWLWTGSIRGYGYGQFWYKGTNCKASRVSYELFVGDPGASQVLHKCDVRLCVNPHHLYAGTHTQNMNDRNSRGRQARGFQHGSHTKPENRPRGMRHGIAKNPQLVRGQLNGNSRLSEQDVLNIRASFLTPAQLATKYRVARITIYHIRNRRLWKHI